MAMYWCGYHLVLWHAMFLYHFLEYREGFAAGAPEVPLWNLYGSFAVANSTMLICAGLVFPLLLWDMIHFSHKVAGPLVRFQNTLRRMSEGEEIRQIQLRKGDLLDDLRDAFNDYLDSLHERKERLQPESTVVESLSPAIAQATAPTATPVAQSSSSAAEPTSLQHAPLSRERAAAVAAQSPDEFASILYDLRDIQSTVSRVKSEEPAGAGSASRHDDLRID
jgi:methyl-accepting chemotaxis protein